MCIVFNNPMNLERIAFKYGLSNDSKITRIFLTSTQKEELVNHVFFYDFRLFNKIAKSQFFYIIRNKDFHFDVYCCEEAPQMPVSIEKLCDNTFIHVPVDEKYLIKFLSIITPLRVVN